MKSRWLGGKETLTRADHRVYALREPAPNEIERQNIRVEAETGDDAGRDARDHTVVAELLAGERVQAHLTVAWAEKRWIERRDYGTIDAVGLLDPRAAMVKIGVT